MSLDEFVNPFTDCHENFVSGENDIFKAIYFGAKLAGH